MTFWHRFGWSDYAAGFYLDAGSYLISVLTLLAIVVGGSHSAVPVASPAALPPELRLKRSLRTIVGDVVRTLAVVRTDRAMRFVFGSLIALALFASTIYVVMTYSVQTRDGTRHEGWGIWGTSAPA
ncbi:MAG: hypothetical protein IPP20_21025 [Gemmatimonadetes bacterium]|nr:hypothetical protein [Gemmatimonadota bacterium]